MRSRSLREASYQPGAGHDSVGNREIHALTQFLAGFEMRNIFRRDFNRFAGLRVSPVACWSVMHRETAEAAYFHTPTLGQMIDHAIKQQANRQFDVALGQLVVLIYEPLD